MRTRFRLALIAVASLPFAPTAALAGLCYSVSGLPAPAAFSLLPLGPSSNGQIRVLGGAFGVCGPGTPPAFIDGAVTVEEGGDARLAFAYLADRPGCSNGEGEVVVPAPYESGTGQVRLAEGPVADVALIHDPTGTACAANTAPPTLLDPCIPDIFTACLQGNRFAVRANGFAPGFRPRPAFKLTSSSDTAFFSSPGTGSGSSDLELIVKVLNNCSFNNRFWVFAAGLTDVRYTITVTDTQTNGVRTYFNPLREPFAPIQDTSAFATCP